MGLDAAEARSSIRFSLGRTNDEAQVDALIEAVRSAVARLRRVAPVHEHA
jgi:cysteine desulfurase